MEVKLSSKARKYLDKINEPANSRIKNALLNLSHEPPRGEIMTIRQELHSYIDDISESKLIALKPLLATLADDSIVIETNLTEEETTLIRQGMEEYEKDPDSFVSLDDILTADDLAALAEAKTEYARDGLVDEKDIDWS